MNRQLKRANEKSEQRRERDQAKRKAHKQASRILRTAQPRPEPKRKADKKGGARAGGAKDNKPDLGINRPWIAQIYLVFLVILLLSQAFIPQRTDTAAFVIHGFFYLVLGYFLCLWLARRGTKRALFYSVAGGLLLALLVEGLKYVLPSVLPPLTQPTPGASSAPNLLLVAVAAPGIVAGSFLAQFFYRRS